MASYQGGIGGMVRSNVNDFYANKRKIADELAGRAAAYEPIYDPWVGLAKLATAGIAGWNRDRLMRRQQEDEKSAAQTIANALQGDKIDYNVLAGNQFTAPIAAELQLNERQQQLDRNQRRADGLFGQGLQQGSNGVEFIPGYLEAQQQLAGLRRNERESWTPIRDKQGNIIGQQNNNGKMDMFSSKNEDTGPFKGTAMDAQAMNILINGDPNSPEYAAAYNYVSTPKQTIQDGQLVTIRPDMGAYRKPVQAGIINPEIKAPEGKDVPQQINPNQQGNVSVEKVEGLIPTFTQETKQAADYTNRLEQANMILSDLEKQGVTSMSLGGQLASQIGDGLGFNLRNPKFQMQDQAMRSFVNATLRRESGATITTQEFENAKLQYFPQPGDSPEVIKQKAMNRLLVIEGMKQQAGKAYQPMGNQAQPNQQTTTPANNQNQKTRMRYDATTDSFVPVK
ncbi:MAG: hypothetical protein JNK86_04700 [Alphaproteobacteria bacterium]|nr:hypothetical protein [Alphaproteobacteria bacterium]